MTDPRSPADPFDRRVAALLTGAPAVPDGFLERMHAAVGAEEGPAVKTVGAAPNAGSRSVPRRAIIAAGLAAVLTTAAAVAVLVRPGEEVGRGPLGTVAAAVGAHLDAELAGLPASLSADPAAAPALPSSRWVRLRTAGPAAFGPTGTDAAAWTLRVPSSAGTPVTAVLAAVPTASITDPPEARNPFAAGVGYLNTANGRRETVAWRDGATTWVLVSEGSVAPFLDRVRGVAV